MERAAEFRSEYYDGRMFAMSGASFRHVMITGNLAFAMRNGVGDRCVVGTNDLRMRVSPQGLYTYPNIVVICGEPKFADDWTDTLLNPTVLIEVLSPSTEARDRGFQSAQYRRIESLQEYALVSQSEPRIEIFRRQSGGNWLLTEATGMEAFCRFDSIGRAIAVKDVYDKVTFDEQAETSP